MPQSDDIYSAFDRLSPWTHGRLIEPCDHYRKTNEARLAIMIADGEIEPPLVPALRGKQNAIFVGSSTAAERLRLKIYGDNNVIFIGAHCRVGGDIEVKGSGNVIYIGAFTTISSITVNQTGDGGAFVIGDHCMLSSRIQVGNTDGHSIFDLSSGQRINLDKDVYIADKVWIARDVSISKGARINSGVVVGQKAHVSGELHANCVYAGVPARKLRENITWSRCSEPTLTEMEQGAHNRRLKKQEQDLLEKIRRRIKACG